MFKDIFLIEIIAATAVFGAIPAVVYVVLAVLPAGKPTLFGYLSFLVLFGIFSFAALQPLQNGYRAKDFEILLISTMSIAAGVVALAQLWRYWCLRTGRRSHYLRIVVTMAIVLVLSLALYWHLGM